MWDLSACELVDMYEAHIETLNEEFDVEMQRTSWFTSILMNAGNYKKSVKPDKLYVPLSKQKQSQTEEYTKEYVDSQRDSLRDIFKI